MIDRSKVYEAIDSEREYQKKTWPNSVNTIEEGPNDNPHTVGEDILLMEEYIRRARFAWTEVYDTADMEALHMIRKVAGIAVRCMENHGAPKRGETK